jgi:hypothetical protein
MCCKNWYFYVGLLGLCVAVALLRIPEGVKAQPPQAPPPVRQPAVGKDMVEVGTDEVGKGLPERRPAPPKYERKYQNPPKPAPVVVLETKAEGYGEGNEDAAQHAVEAARDKVAEYLTSKYGETLTPKRLEWLTEEVKKQPIVGEPTYEVMDLQWSGKVQKAVVEVKLTDEQVKAFREEARHDRQKGRMRTAGLVLAGLMALLLVGGGYLRLEEATKGYYTTLLRIGALGTVAFVGLSLYVLWTKFWV